MVNVAVAQDPAGNLKPAKDKSTERIDGIVALTMPIGRAMLPQDPAPSYSMLILGWRSVLRRPDNPHQPRHERAFPRPLADEVIAALMGAWP